MILGNRMCPYNRVVTPEKLAELSQAIQKAIDARNAAIVQAAAAGIPKTVVCEATGLTKEQVRRIERAGGAPKRAAGRPPGTGKATD